MKKEEVDKFMRFFPALRSYRDYYVFFDVNDYKRHDKSEMVESPRGYRKIRSGLLEELLNNDDYFQSVKRLYDGAIVRTRVCYLGYPKMISAEFYSKKELLQFFHEGIKNNKIQLSEKGKERLNYIENKMSYESFINDYKNKKIEINIEGKLVNFNVNSFINVMDMSDEEYEIFFKDTKEINGIPKIYFAYSLKHFLNTESLFEKYIMPESWRNKYELLRSYDLIDFEAVNNILESDIKNYDGVELKKELKEHLYKDMPSNLSDIEKAIFLYARACKLFTYDEEFYLSGQKGVAALRHQDINRLNEIDVNNKEIVCYEFTALYGKLLDELGIKFEVDYTVTNEYGSGHNKLVFKEGKYIVEVDSVTTIFRGDMVRAKVDYPLEGIKCLNANEETQQKFINNVNKIYNMVNILEKPFDEAVSEYEKIIDLQQTMSFDEKLEIYLDKISKSAKKLNRMDALGYAFLLSKVLFTEEEKTHNINFGVFKKENEKKDRSLLIISVNKAGFDKNNNNTKHLIYELDGRLNYVDRNELKRRIDSREITVADQNKSKVPGLED